MREDGVEVVTNAYPQALERTAAGELELVVANGRRLPPADCVLWAIGRAALRRGSRARGRRA